MTFNTLNHAKFHLTNSNEHSNASHLHSNITNIQINTYNLQMRTCTPTMLQILKSPNLKHQKMLQTCTNASPSQSILKAHPNTWNTQHPLHINWVSNSNSRTSMSGPITYWSTIELEIKLHKQTHIYKFIWPMFGVRWSPPFFVLPLLALFLLQSYNIYGLIIYGII